MAENPGTRVSDVQLQDSHGRSSAGSKVKDQVTGQSMATVAQDNVEGPREPDPAAVVSTKRMRAVIFFSICQGVQAFMSYDGGATPASLDTIMEEMPGQWTAGEFGVLGAMDKIGMTVTSMMWGRLLQFCPAKILLVVGLLLNALCTAAFGSLKNKAAMYSAKFLMGSTQSLQGVWGTVWTVVMAPPAKKTMWLGFGAISAGVGNGIGTGVAGFGTANGLGYAFAFRLQALVLFLFWLFLLCLPAYKLRTTLPSSAELERQAEAGKEGQDPASSGAAALESPPGMREQCKALLTNRVYGYTVLAISLAMFEVSGIQFLWVRVFVDVWRLNKNWVTLMFLLVSGLGGGVGMALGPPYIDRMGGYSAPPGVLKSLLILRGFNFIAAFAGILGTACLYGKLRARDELEIPHRWGDAWLWITWLAVFFIQAAHTAAIPALCGINCDVVPDNMRTFGAGTEMTFRNILGYAAGPLLPGVIMDLLAEVNGWDVERYDDLSQQLCSGLTVLFLGNLLGVWILGRAVTQARANLHAEQGAVRNELQEALRSDDLKVLEKAVINAKRVDFHRVTDGQAIMGMANQIIGRGRALGRGKSGEGLEALDRRFTYEELQKKVLALQSEVLELRSENQKLRDAMGSAFSEVKEPLIVSAPPPASPEEAGERSTLRSL